MHLPALGNNLSFFARNAYDFIFISLRKVAIHLSSYKILMTLSFVKQPIQMHIVTLLWVLRSKVQKYYTWLRTDWRRNKTCLTRNTFWGQGLTSNIFQAKGWSRIFFRPRVQTLAADSLQGLRGPQVSNHWQDAHFEIDWNFEIKKVIILNFRLSPPTRTQSGLCSIIRWELKSIFVTTTVPSKLCLSKSWLLRNGDLENDISNIKTSISF